jgi:nicotinamide-nucleotide adenylyltransferase
MKSIMKNVNELIIVIGSAQKSHEIGNPFTAGERIMMLKQAFQEAEIPVSKCFFIPVPDLRMHSLWVAHVIAYSPHFNVVYSNDPLTRRLFDEAGIKVEHIPFFDREIYSSTEVRRRMLVDEDWRALLPKSVSNIIDEIGGVERIKDLSMTDSPTKRSH